MVSVTVTGAGVPHWVRSTRRLFHINNFAGSAALVEVCVLLSAVLFVHYTNICSVHTVNLASLQ